MVDVSQATIDLTVFGGPSSVDVDLDFGPTGRRGSLIFASIGVPSSSTSGINTSNLFVNDIAINVDTGSSSYLDVFQYQANPTGNSWVKIAKLTSNNTVYTKTVTFTNGQAVVDIPVSAFTSFTGNEVTPAIFSVFASFHKLSDGSESLLPTAHSIVVNNSFIDPPTSGVTERSLRVTIDAVEVNSSLALAKVAGARKVSFYIVLGGING